MPVAPVEVRKQVTIDAWTTSTVALESLLTVSCVLDPMLTILNSNAGTIGVTLTTTFNNGTINRSKSQTWSAIAADDWLVLKPANSPTSGSSPVGLLVSKLDGTSDSAVSHDLTITNNHASLIEVEVVITGWYWEVNTAAVNNYKDV